jgi:hypothetical protein
MIRQRHDLLAAAVTKVICVMSRVPVRRITQWENNSLRLAVS